MDDARQRAVGGKGCHAQLQLATGVDAAGKHGIARRFVNRNAFPGDRRLVDGAVAFGHHAIERHALAGFQAHLRIQGHRCHRHGRPRTARLPHQCRGRCQIQQALDGVAGAVHRLGFNPFGNRVQRHHHGGFRPLANQKRTGDRHSHQRIDAKLAAQQRRNAFFVGVNACQRNGHGGGCHAHVRPHPLASCEKRQQLSPHSQRQCQRVTANAAAARVMRRLTTDRAARSGHRANDTLRLIARAPNRLLGLRVQSLVAAMKLDAQRARTQLKTQRTNARQGLQCAPNVRLLSAAVHGADAVQPSGSGCCLKRSAVNASRSRRIMRRVLGAAAA